MADSLLTVIGWIFAGFLGIFLLIFTVASFLGIKDAIREHFHD